MTSKMFDISKTIAEYKTCELAPVDLSTLGSYSSDDFTVEVIDSGLFSGLSTVFSRAFQTCHGQNHM